jgi:Domain of unknown function (DUF4268)
VWVAEKVRDEHRQTLEWLNRHTDTGIKFFAIVIEVLQIQNSPRAVNFKPVVLPNEWLRTTKVAAEGASPRAEAYRRYFQALLDELRDKHHFTSARVGLPQSWYSFRSGVPGVYYGTGFAQGGRIRAEIYIDFGDSDSNKALFDRLHTDRELLERGFGERLTWERLDERRASWIAVYRPGSIDLADGELNQVRVWAIDRLLKFKSALGPRIRELAETAINSGV